MDILYYPLHYQRYILLSTLLPKLHPTDLSYTLQPRLYSTLLSPTLNMLYSPLYYPAYNPIYSSLYWPYSEMEKVSDINGAASANFSQLCYFLFFCA